MRLQASGVTRPSAPVLGDATDEAVVFAVFAGWKTSKDQQAQFNPWAEVQFAHALRDEVVASTGIKRGALVSDAFESEFAVEQLRVGLLMRGWRQDMIDRYLGKLA